MTLTFPGSDDTTAVTGPSAVAGGAEPAAATGAQGGAAHAGHVKHAMGLLNELGRLPVHVQAALPNVNMGF